MLPRQKFRLVQALRLVHQLERFLHVSWLLKSAHDHRVQFWILWQKNEGGVSEMKRSNRNIKKQKNIATYIMFNYNLWIIYWTTIYKFKFHSVRVV